MFQPNTSLYPFQNNWVTVDGHRMHYVDEGKGEVLLMVHGIPEWSFAYRHIIQHFSKTHHCIAIDNLGFGLSDKPTEADFTPRGHSLRLGKIIEQLGLRNIHLFVHDYGGPIGFGYALFNADNIRTITLSQTWMWPLNDIDQFKPLKFFSGTIGKWLYLKLNFSVNFMMPQSYANRALLTKEIHSHYRAVMSNPRERTAVHQLMLEMLRSKDWFTDMWNARNNVRSKPTLILWAMKDKFFPEAVMLSRWMEVFENPTVVRLSESGHFIQEEAHREVCDALEAFLPH